MQHITRSQEAAYSYICLELLDVSLCSKDTDESELLGKWFDCCSPPPELAGPAGGAEEAIGTAFLTNHAPNQTNPVTTKNNILSERNDFNTKSQHLSTLSFPRSQKVSENPTNM